MEEALERQIAPGGVIAVAGRVELTAPIGRITGRVGHRGATMRRIRRRRYRVPHHFPIISCRTA